VKTTLIFNYQTLKTALKTVLLSTIVVVAVLLLAMTLFIVPASVTGENLADIPSWNQSYYPSVSQYAFFDNQTTFKGAETLRLDQGGELDVFGAMDRAVWTSRIPVDAGDQIYVSAYIKTEPSSVQDTEHGARIGVDFYVDGHIVDAVESRYVRWNTSSWTPRSISVVIPNQTYTQDQFGNPIDPAPIDSVAFWLQALNGNDSGSVWFAHTVFYKNPDRTCPDRQR
jgi:hypothetical protein